VRVSSWRSLFTRIIFLCLRSWSFEQYDLMEAQAGQTSGDMANNAGKQRFLKFISEAAGASDKRRKTFWNEMLAEHKGGQPFEIEYDGVTIQIQMLADGVVTCAMTCCKPRFGETPTTRSEFSAKKHCMMHGKQQPESVPKGASAQTGSLKLKQATFFQPAPAAHALLPLPVSHLPCRGAPKLPPHQATTPHMCLSTKNPLTPPRVDTIVCRPYCPLIYSPRPLFNPLRPPVGHGSSRSS